MYMVTNLFRDTTSVTIKWRSVKYLVFMGVVGHSHQPLIKTQSYTNENGPSTALR